MAGLTVKGVPMNASQKRYADLIIAAGSSLNAGSIATGAVIVEAIAESSLGEAMGWDSQNPRYGGLLAGSVDNFGHLGGASSPAVTAAEINAAFKGGQGYAAGGAIGLARNSNDLLQIAMTNSGSGSQFLSEAGHQNFAAEAKAILAAGGGGALKGGVAGSGGSGTIPDGSKSTTYAFSISGTDNPDEDYWTGINRLAQEVNWYLFTSGEYLYYLDGQEMLAQRPAMHLHRVANAGQIYQNQGTLVWDNTSYNFVADHKRRFHTQRRTKVAMAQSPTEGTFELLCGIDEVLGGDVVVLSGFGPGDGRWIVGECRRSVFQPYSEITLVPALAPITEAIAAGTTGQPAQNGAPLTQATGHGTLAKVADLAQRAAALQSQKHVYSYTQGSGRTNNGNGVLSPPYTFDCSGFCEACYKFAGLGDPAGNTNYAGTSFDIGGPGPRSDACVQIGQASAVPGDLVVFPNHVVIYIGGGNCVSMGGRGDPIVTSVANEAAGRGVTGYFHLRGAK